MKRCGRRRANRSISSVSNCTGIATQTLINKVAALALIKLRFVRLSGRLEFSKHEATKQQQVIRAFLIPDAVSGFVLSALPIVLQP